MDTQGFGMQNLSNPTGSGSISGITVSNVNVTGEVVNLSDPSSILLYPMSTGVQGAGPNEWGGGGMVTPVMVGNVSGHRLIRTNGAPTQPSRPACIATPSRQLGEKDPLILNGLLTTPGLSARSTSGSKPPTPPPRPRGRFTAALRRLGCRSLRQPVEHALRHCWFYGYRYRSPVRRLF